MPPDDAPQQTVVVESGPATEAAAANAQLAANAAGAAIANAAEVAAAAERAASVETARIAADANREMNAQRNRIEETWQTATQTAQRVETLETENRSLRETITGMAGNLQSVTELLTQMQEGNHQEAANPEATRDNRADQGAGAQPQNQPSRRKRRLI